MQFQSFSHRRQPDPSRIFDSSALLDPRSNGSKKKAPSTPPFACSYGRNDEMRQEKETGKKKGVQI
jgi:hypothetical protein